MSFPVLTAHQIYPCFFQLGGRLSPISIRDQMVRGQMLVEQAFHAGLIGGNDRRPLLVVGAGAAGATVALTAARLGVPTLMVDEGAAPFRLQAGCRTRLLDPAHYDWPLEQVMVKPRYQAAGDLVRQLAIPQTEVSGLLHYEERAQRAYHWGDRAMTAWNGYDHAVLDTCIP